MIDETDKPEAKPRATEPDGPQAGQRLAAARREKQITVLEVAKELHLDEPKVRALEQNRFEVLGAPVFAKGHLRKYATLVGVGIDDVLADYYALNRSAGMPPVVGKVRKQGREISPGPWIAAFVVLVFAATAWWWFFEREPGPTLSDAGRATPAVSGEIAAANDPDTETADRVEMPQVQVVTEAPAFEDSLPEDSQPEEAVLVGEPLVEGQIELSMVFSGDCWTEISDANGRRLFFALGQDGRTSTVTGQAPLSVLFGNADNVSVRVNGADYTIAASDRRGQTARLTIVSP
ncbi:MAG: helix-turn-helix domain-containing protein [Woeseiaceae bacterium]